MAAGWLLLIGLLWKSFFVEGAPSGASVSSLPGYSENFVSKHYAGYVTVDEHHDRSLYYYFVSSEGNPASDPLVLWLNGGPGCSSFDGFVYEHGPFVFQPGASGAGLPTLTKNPYSWAKVANMLYVDSPAGVGFSYSNDTSDYKTDDAQTAKDAHTFVLKWLKLYPEFQSNPFYVSGESYAGVYVPTITREIVAGIKNGSSPRINLKGYLIGNGVTDPVMDGNALVPFVHGMGLIPEDLYLQTVDACNGSFWNITTEPCETKVAEIQDAVGDLNLYNILEPCYHQTSASAELYGNLPSTFSDLGKTDRPMPVRKRIFGRAWPLGMTLKDGPVPTWAELSENNALIVPCIDDSVAVNWLNNAQVRSALHALPESAIGEWVLCTSRVKYTHNAGSMMPVHSKLLSGGYRALIYSGDHDMCVPYTGSEAWTIAMGYKVIDQWRPWYVRQQVAGYTRAFENNLTFATVKGGKNHHTCISTSLKPRSRLYMDFRAFLSVPSAMCYYVSDNRRVPFPQRVTRFQNTNPWKPLLCSNGGWRVIPCRDIA